MKGWNMSLFATAIHYLIINIKQYIWILLNIKLKQCVIGPCIMFKMLL